MGAICQYHFSLGESVRLDGHLIILRKFRKSLIGFMMRTCAKTYWIIGERKPLTWSEFIPTINWNKGDSSNFVERLRSSLSGRNERSNRTKVESPDSHLGFVCRDLLCAH